MSQLNRRALSIMSSEGIAGLMRRLSERLRRRPQFINLYVLKLDYKDVAKLLPPTMDLEITEVVETDDRETEALAGFGFYGQSKRQILQFLAERQRCYVAKHDNRVVSCYWRATGEYYDYSLKRRLYLADNEEYLLGFFTLAEFRGQGIFPYLLESSSAERTRNCANLQAVIFVRVDNQASLRSSHKLGFKIVGRVGFIEIFGIRLHFLLGREVLPKTTRRIFLQFF